MKDIKELIGDIETLRKEFVERKLYVAGQLGLKNKQINTFIKENIQYAKEATDEEKIKAYDELKNLYVQRNVIKKELKIFQDIDEGNKFTFNMLGHTLNEYNKINMVIEQLDEIGYNPINTNIKFVPMIGVEKNSNEFILKKKELESEYDKVIFDIEDSTFYCYNKCRAV